MKRKLSTWVEINISIIILKPGNNDNKSDKLYLTVGIQVWYIVMMFNATFNNISAISWRSVLLVEEPGENHWPATSHWQTLSHNVVLNTHRHERDSVFKFWFKVKYLSTSKWIKLSFQPMKIPNEKHRFICTHLTGEQRKLNKVRLDHEYAITVKWHMPG